MRNAKVRASSFWVGLATEPSPSRRELPTPTRKEIKDFDAHAELASLLVPLLAEATNEDFAAYEAGRIAQAIINSGYRKSRK